MIGWDIFWRVLLVSGLAVWAALVVLAVINYLKGRTEVDETDDDSGIDNTLERRIAALKEGVDKAVEWAPCQWCLTPDKDCKPYVAPCCTMCEANPTRCHLAWKTPIPSNGD